ncbi:MAG: lactonase family protein [Planctomycetes bacterium]|nr:lactonase family protein [Planctomycetota bacterium]
MRMLLLLRMLLLIGLWLAPALAAVGAEVVYVSAAGDGQIVRFALDAKTGQLTRQGETAVEGAPGPLTTDPKRRFLFASLRSAGKLASFRLDAQSGELTHINTVEAGADPAYVATDRTGRFLLSAYYAAGKVAVHAIGEDGSLSREPVQEIETDEKAHAIVPDRSNRFVFVPHTGPNRIFQFRFDETIGRLSPNDPPIVERPNDTGPRHLTFHPFQNAAYVSDEQGSSVTAYRFRPAAGVLEAGETWSTLPKTFRGGNSCSDIQITPDGRFVYVANRGHDSIAEFLVHPPTGDLVPLGQAETEKTPRSFHISPSGEHLIAAGQATDKLAVYRIDEGTGKLNRLHTYEAGAQPWWVLIVETTRDDADAAAFESDWKHQHDRIWIGPEYWANPMEDWRLIDGRLECYRGGVGRSVHLLTRRLSPRRGELEMSVVIGRAGVERIEGSAGFEIGIRSELGDYRSSLLTGRGVRAGIALDGTLFIDNQQKIFTKEADFPADGVRLRLKAAPQDDDQEDDYVLSLSAEDPDTGEVLAEMSAPAPAAHMHGNVALVNNFPVTFQDTKPQPKRRPPGQAKFWFSDWRLSGDKLSAHDDRTFGPILYAMHTLSRGVMKLTAQMPSMGEEDEQSVTLQVRRDAGRWRNIDEATIDPLSGAATFRIENWDAGRDTPYRVVYRMSDRDGPTTEHSFTGAIRRDPVEKETIVVAGFTGNTDPAFPNALLARNVAIHDPDVLFFSGDQIYENVGGFGIHREPVDLAVLNYLRKIWLWGWAFRDVMRDRPTLAMPDDHDVYQGNIWGQGGRAVAGIADHDKGGYAMHPNFVNAVQRTQTSHHPDPYDPRPVEQDIGVYYGDMVYGRVSFAVIEDRKFKSGPAGKVNYWEGRPDHVTDPDFDPESIDKPGLKLLGDRQLEFLRHWAQDWRGADFKTVCSQTIFCNLANYHGADQMFLVADLDSNGWPQTPRDAALREMRKGFAFHYAGDQHLPSIVHYGVDTWSDAGYAFCVPSIAAGYPRSWRPDEEGRPVQNRPADGLPNTGEYIDGLGNYVTVHAIGNPEAQRRRPVLQHLHDKSSGYGLVRFNKKDRSIDIHCWRLLIDAAHLQPGDQFPGWPKKIALEDNYGRKAAAHLPEIRVTGLTDPVVQVIDEADGEIVYTLRIKGNVFRPKVFREGPHTIVVSDPERDRQETLEGVEPAAAAERLDVSF